jgi:predicted acyl esterase
VDGSSILLTTDLMRARYREGPRKEVLIQTKTPLCYDFKHFAFTSRQIRKGHRLRLVIGPINSIYSQRNFNGGGVVAEESIEDARPVTVVLHHDRSYPSALYTPFGRPESSEELIAPFSSFLHLRPVDSA